ncbi:hypothetical protein TL16_g06205 [Triparma laevis f. inornata]|uniref:G domain-containing protein n=1 Tax=Triparma laevis f. inornata TaxID=1714386 RepID=A0A9W7ECB6_9STRA|nr:hypothetical protein TL16_g06205 [Triparma laevis f. inornata]
MVLMLHLLRCSPFTVRVRVTRLPPLRPLRPLRPLIPPTRLLSTTNNNLPTSDSYDPDAPTGPPINWYPGHISSAETQLSKTLSTVDLILEVRDSRAIHSTSHPKIESWSLGVQRIIVCSKSDLIPEGARKLWSSKGFEAFRDPLQIELNAQQKEITLTKKKNQGTTSTLAHVLFSDVRTLKVHDLKKHILRLSTSVNTKRTSKGLLPRAIRVAVVGFPNTGKSMLINKLVGRRIVKSQNTPGVTRQLHWVKIKGEGKNVETERGVVMKSSRENSFELLDTPGIIPTKLVSLTQGNVLAGCGLVGEKGYDNVNVAGMFLERIRWLIEGGWEGVCCPEYRRELKKRYGLDILEGEPSLFLHTIADETCSGDLENAAVKVIQDFRQGRMGKVCLEVPMDNKVEVVDVEEEKWEDGREGREEKESKRREMEEEGKFLPKEEGGDPYKRFDGW